ncbi:hypothetical protein SAMN06265338_13514 [Rhodoblastus acidophilus]|uniref:Uncharacterized protein n=1 Tax=Rhodoblastus acidophilus TaxID=1074 RepID=A0A212SFN2_RHOAC|nr:hypothetical protein SAMN06265338_13514 [Rhodoblastus acidophilus]
MTIQRNRVHDDVANALAIRLAARAETCRPVRERFLLYTQKSLVYAQSHDRAIWLACVRYFAAHKHLEETTETREDNTLKIAALQKERQRALDKLKRERALTIYGVLLKYNILLVYLVDRDEIVELIQSCLRDCDLLILTQDSTDLTIEDPRLATLVATVRKLVEQLAIEAERYDIIDHVGFEIERNAIIESMRGLAVEVEDAILLLSRQPATTLGGLRAKLYLFKACDELSSDGDAMAALKLSMCRDLDRLLRYLGNRTPLLGAKTSKK